ncbi:MAG: hypothetical protein OXD30_09985 [Bryobacterales bacterium]|nr:hypothetical protein [Bryobacterales bacterium]
MSSKPKKKNVPYGGGMRAGSVVGIAAQSEPWSAAELEDGTEIGIRPGIAEAIRLGGEYGADGQPVYVALSQNIMSVNAPEHRHNSVSREGSAMSTTSSGAVFPVGQAPSTFNQSARFSCLYCEDGVMRAKFEKLVLQWREQRRFTSSLEEMTACPAHLEILAMGKPAVELIMDRLRAEAADHWFRTLELLTGAQPVRHEDRGDYEKMRRAWLGWRDRQA